MFDYLRRLFRSQPSQAPDASGRAATENAETSTPRSGERRVEAAPRMGSESSSSILTQNDSRHDAQVSQLAGRAAEPECISPADAIRRDAAGVGTHTTTGSAVLDGERKPEPEPALSPTPATVHPGVVAALAAFDAGKLAESRALLERAVTRGPLDRAGRELLDLVLPRVGVAPIVERVLAGDHDEMTLLEQTHWLARRFDERVANGHTAHEEALDLLAAATLADEPGWALVRSPVRWDAIEAAFVAPSDRIDLLEQESFAPPATGIPATVVGQAQAFAQERLRHGDLACAREAERLLHLTGHRDIAYQLEAERKRLTRARSRVWSTTRPTHRPRRLQIVVAGGHPELRRLARADLDQLNLASVRAFPSSWEGNRQGRHAREAIDGADLAVVIWRQISHSTSDQVTTAARALSVPVVWADTPTISSIRRAVESFPTDQAPGS